MAQPDACVSIQEEIKTHTLQLRCGLPDKSSVIYNSVFRCVRFGLESAEERLLCTQDLNGRSGLLGKTQQAAAVGHQTGADDLAHLKRADTTYFQVYMPFVTTVLLYCIAEGEVANPKHQVSRRKKIE